MMNRRSIFLILIPVGIMLLLVNSCQDDVPLPDNPYDDIVRDDSTANQIPVDSLTITYVHKKVLSSRCALPGCHDGNFEPDFRTPQSSFSTLVYATINKNNTAKTFKYRVIPYDLSKSVLHERITNCCFVTANDRMPQDNIGNILPDSSLDVINVWIQNGARDMFGNVAVRPDVEPLINPGVAATSSDFLTFYSNNRLDGLYYNPFIVPLAATSFYVVGLKTSDDNTLLSQMQYNKLKISTKADDFSTSFSYTCTYFSNATDSFWYVSVPTASLPAGDTLFMRYFVNDGHHANNTEFPKNESLFPYKTFWSFIRQ